MTDPQFTFWRSPQWARYCAAHGGPTTDNNSPDNIVVPLGPDVSMLGAMRRDHRVTINRMHGLALTICEWPGSFAFRQYQHLHELDAGRKTRPQETFDIMDSWLGTNGLLLLASVVGQAQPIGAAYFILDRPGAYYASAARMPGVKGPIHHYLIWSAMQMLALRGYQYLDLGHPETPAIHEFKRGFIKEGRGGISWPSAVGGAERRGGSSPSPSAEVASG